MTTKAELEKHLDNPNVRKMLDLISYSEGTTKNGYYTAFGGGRQDSLATHENRRQSFKQTDGKSNVSGAAGRYQFLKGTWNGVAKKYGLNDFSERNQDIGALALIAEKGQLQNVLNGNLRTAVANLGSVWASFPSSPYKQKKHSWDTIDGYLTSGTWKGKPTATSTATATPTNNTSTDLLQGLMSSLQSQQAMLQQGLQTAQTPSTGYKPLEYNEPDLFTTMKQSQGSDVLSMVGGIDPVSILLGSGRVSSAAQSAMQPEQSNTLPLFTFM